MTKEELHRFRASLGNQIRRQWLDHQKTLIPSIRSLSNEEQQAIVLAALGSRGREVSEDEMANLLDDFKKTLAKMGMYEMAMIGMADLEMRKNGEVAAGLTEEAAKELGPQLNG